MFLWDWFTGVLGYLGKYLVFFCFITYILAIGPMFDLGNSNLN